VSRCFSDFNAFVVILGSFLITFWIAFDFELKLWLMIYIKLLVTIGVVLAGLFGWILFYEKLENIKDRIRNLK